MVDDLAIAFAISFPVRDADLHTTYPLRQA
jgi:hypothetical protein